MTDTDAVSTTINGSPSTVSPWLTVTEAADRGRCGVKLLYREIRAGRLKAARIGGRREYRLRPEWIDQWLDASSTVVDVTRGR
jgi:excisionase family DNA binding protein